MGNLWVKHSFGLDTRSLALLRVGTGVVLIVDLFLRFPELRNHYSDRGVLPRALLSEISPPLYFSIHSISGEVWVQGVLFLLAFLCALALVFGIRTRWATLLSWILCVSLCNRNPHILLGGDRILMLVLFWGLFLPWGKCCSLDAHFGNKSRNSTHHTLLNFGTAGFVVQMAILYTFAGLLKRGPEWYPDGTAIQYVLLQDQYTTSLANFSLQFPQLLQWLTLWVFWLESLSPLFLFFPILSGFFRTGVVFGLWTLHLGIAMHMHLGTFPWVCIIAVSGLLPSWFWTHFFRLFPFLRRNPFDFIGKRWPVLSKLCQKDFNTVSIHHKAFHFLSQGLAIFFIFFTVARNFNDLRLFQIPNGIRWVGPALRLEQSWVVFAPSPPKIDGWPMIVGTLVGAPSVEIDLWRKGLPVDWSKPKSVSTYLISFRWRKYLRMVGKKEELRPYFAEFICRQWNSTPTKQLDHFTFYSIIEKSLDDFSEAPLERFNVWQHRCAA